jgi:16S rRNA (cytosine1402-N4)-methyltransferase
MRDGPLDMRMDPLSGFSAAEWVNNAPPEEIVHILRKYGEEAFASKIARKICETRTVKAIATTLELANLIESCLPAKKNHRHPATKTFQAIRLHVNQELKAIDDVLASARDVLALDGRLVIISFHSLEDRIVKRYFREQSRCKIPKGIAIPEKDLTTPFKWVIKRQFPSTDEIGINQRARSAVLRVAQRTAF